MFEEMLKIERGNEVFAKRNVAAFAEFERKDNGRAAFQRPSFGIDNKYTLLLNTGVDFISNDVELKDKTEKAKKQLMHALFKDVISDLHEIGNLAEQDEVSRKIYLLIEKLHTT